ncbi:hypothetical protein BH23ACT6_BH23ACT6_20770 [soil metagenome]
MIAAVVLAIAGGGAGVWLRRWLGDLGYRNEAEAQAPLPGGRWWVPVVSAVVSAALAYRLWDSPARADPGSALDSGDASGIAAAQIVVLLVLVVASWACIALAAIDQDVHRLPDRITGPTVVWLVLGLAVAAVLGAGWAPWLRMLACALASGLFYLVLSLLSLTRGSSALGLGDVKLSVVLGAALGWFGIHAVILGLYAGFLIGGVWAVGLLVARRVNLGGHLAFGPPMMLGALCALLLPATSVGSMF